MSAKCWQSVEKCLPRTNDKKKHTTNHSKLYASLRQICYNVYIIWTIIPRKSSMFLPHQPAKTDVFSREKFEIILWRLGQYVFVCVCVWLVNTWVCEIYGDSALFIGLFWHSTAATSSKTAKLYTKRRSSQFVAKAKPFRDHQKFTNFVIAIADFMYIIANKTKPNNVDGFSRSKIKLYLHCKMQL